MMVQHPFPFPVTSRIFLYKLPDGGEIADRAIWSLPRARRYARFAIAGNECFMRSPF